MFAFQRQIVQARNLRGVRRPLIPLRDRSNLVRLRRVRTVPPPVELLQPPAVLGPPPRRKRRPGLDRGAPLRTEEGALWENETPNLQTSDRTGSELLKRYV